jgi:hypothetical protein
MSEDTRQIPKTWCAAVAAIIRAGKPESVLIRQRARRDWMSLPWNPFDYELLDALADTLETGNLNGKAHVMDEPGETYSFIFYRENFPIYTKINLTNQQIVIVYSAHRPLKGEQL